MQEEDDPPEPGPTVSPAPQAAVTHARKLVIFLQTRDGKKRKFIVNSDTPFGTVFDAFCSSTQRERDCVAFSFDGDAVTADATPAALDMEDDDVIDVRDV